MARDLERIATSIPLNKTAGLVTSKGVHWTPDRKPANALIRASADLLPVNNSPKISATAIFRELVGNTFGRWKVIGYAATQAPNKKSRWVVKCSCGRYEHRHAKTIRRAPQTGDKCGECQHLDYVRRSYKFHGGKAPEQFGAASEKRSEA
jgi:hypothetical protein